MLSQFFCRYVARKIFSFRDQFSSDRFYCLQFFHISCIFYCFRFPPTPPDFYIFFIICDKRTLRWAIRLFFLNFQTQIHTYVHICTYIMYHSRNATFLPNLDFIVFFLFGKILFNILKKKKIYKKGSRIIQNLCFPLNHFEIGHSKL